MQPFQPVVPPPSIGTPGANPRCTRSEREYKRTFTMKKTTKSAKSVKLNLATLGKGRKGAISSRALLLIRTGLKAGSQVI
jgi:hypothetical protein